MSRLLRSAAHDVVSWRDGFSGWRTARGAVRALLASSPDEVARQQQLKLRRLLLHAYRTVPYYRETWPTLGFTPTSATTAAELVGLPLLSKDVIRYERARLTSEAFAPDQLDLDCTSGTTGSRTSFYRDRGCRVARVGRQWGILEHCGYQPGDRRGLIWGVAADLPPRSATQTVKRRFRRFARANESMYCRVMSHDDMLEYYRRLRRFRPAVLYGYPNAIEQFARFVQRERLSPIEVRRIFCTAEQLNESQRALFQQVFGGEVFNLYCSRELGCVGFECHRHRGLHVDAGSVLVEILNNGQPAAPGESGELVITDLLNFGMPLIRYATGDLATRAIAPCDCGCPLPFIARLDGRKFDVLYRPDGSVVAGVLLSFLFMGQPSITLAQFVQEDSTSLDIYLVVDDGGSSHLQDAVIEETRPVMGPDVEIRVHFVPDIPRNPRSGKFQQVVCKIARPASGEADRAGHPRESGIN
ncbi:MAG: phenylacetate--CoA ligase family protein, partial [Vicinamibacteraceae bacterium]